MKLPLSLRGSIRLVKVKLNFLNLQWLCFSKSVSSICCSCILSRNSGIEMGVGISPQPSSWHWSCCSRSCMSVFGCLELCMERGRGQTSSISSWSCLAGACISHKGILIPSNPVLEGDTAGTAGLCAEQRYTGWVLHMEGVPAACALLLELKDTKAAW